jgi:hypothetical protein
MKRSRDNFRDFLFFGSGIAFISSCQRYYIYKFAVIEAKSNTVNEETPTSYFFILLYSRL